MSKEFKLGMMSKAISDMRMDGCSPTAFVIHPKNTVVKDALNKSDSIRVGSKLTNILGMTYLGLPFQVDTYMLNPKKNDIYLIDGSHWSDRWDVWGHYKASKLVYKQIDFPQIRPNISEALIDRTILEVRGNGYTPDLIVGTADHKANLEAIVRTQMGIPPKIWDDKMLAYHFLYKGIKVVEYKDIPFFDVEEYPNKVLVMDTKKVVQYKDAVAELVIPCCSCSVCECGCH